MLVLARVGTANVIELGTARALGEVEALEAMGIDPVHYLIMPRVIGMTLGVFALTIYLILGALASGCLFAFLANVPLTPGDYIQQITGALGLPNFRAAGVQKHDLRIFHRHRDVLSWPRTTIAAG